MTDDLYKIEKNIANFADIFNKLDEINKVLDEINKNLEEKIDKLTKNIYSLQSFTSIINALNLYFDIAKKGFAFGYTHANELPIEVVLAPNETKIYNLSFQEGFAVVIPHIEIESNISYSYISVKINPKECLVNKVINVKVPQYFVDLDTVITNYKIPIIRVVRNLPFVPTWCIQIKLSNKSTTDNANVYVTFPYMEYDEKMLVNFYFNMINRLYNVLYDLSEKSNVIVEEIIEKYYGKT